MKNFEIDNGIITLREMGYFKEWNCTNIIMIFLKKELS